MDYLHASLALGPVAMYFLLLGMINLSSRPLVTSGLRDAGALGIAASGFAIVGPMELFIPDWAPGWLAWPVMIALYFLTLTLVVLLLRPRIVIYNTAIEQLRPILAEVIARLDKDGRVAGESVFLPNLGIQFHIEATPNVKHVQLRSAGAQQSYNGWTELENALRTALKEVRGTPNQVGVGLIAIGIVLLGMIGYWMVASGPEVRDRLAEMLRLPPPESP